jgi:hypothetical protein
MYCALDVEVVPSTQRQLAKTRAAMLAAVGRAIANPPRIQKSSIAKVEVRYRSCDDACMIGRQIITQYALLLAARQTKSLVPHPASWSPMNRSVYFLAAITCLLAYAARAEPLQSLDQTDLQAERQALEAMAEIPDVAPAAKARLSDHDRAGPAEAGKQLRNRREHGTRRIVNGLYSFRHAAVAGILRGANASTAQAWCTGTLVACDKVLTAAHCISEHEDPAGYHVYFPHTGVFSVARISWLKSEYKFPYADLAILHVATPVEGIQPIAINLTGSPGENSNALIVGYGRSGGTNSDYGIKREGSVKFSSCKGAFADKRLLCWNFDAEINQAHSHSNTCNADSGGGVFMLEKSGQRTAMRLVGVVSGGIDSNCVKADHSYNTDVFKWRDWLTSEGVYDPSPKICKSKIEIDRPSNVRSAVAKLSAARPEAHYEVSIGDGLASLRVAMNGDDDGHSSNDFDLRVYSPDSISPECSQDAPGQFAYCEVRRPAAGLWKISVTRKVGEGTAQVTVTAVPKDRPD